MCEENCKYAEWHTVYLCIYVKNCNKNSKLQQVFIYFKKPELVSIIFRGFIVDNYLSKKNISLVFFASV